MRSSFWRRRRKSNFKVLDV